MQQQLALVSCLLLIFACHSQCRPAADDSPGRALGGGAWAIGPASSDNNGLPSEFYAVPASTTNPPPSTYRLGTKPGGLRLITDQDKDVRIIFLFDLKPVHLFRRQYIRNRNAIRNIITKDDV